jgi:Spx/MgsR family transcriptional regulator
MLTVYGIKSCDTCRRARAWLDANEIGYRFHDLRDDGIDRPMVARWVERVGWETLLNKRSLTWRGLDDAERNDLGSDKAISLMLEHPTLVKRPVIEADRYTAVGFSERRLSDYLSKQAGD